MNLCIFDLSIIDLYSITLCIVDVVTIYLCIIDVYILYLYIIDLCIIDLFIPDLCIDDLQDFDSGLFLARGHLSPNADFIFYSWMDSTYHFVNVAPQWQAFNGQAHSGRDSGIQAVQAFRLYKLSISQEVTGCISRSV